ncbi:hypothetical protein HELRODRAFT_154769 [Helobdella robusta]|uniref:Splicing factor Cactin n=1 Tax=Helobdella robusta TaxID=6412 RepID=T1ELG1_HELRO|nr:hypothetical protein HELRODRAFT_154769 [Helobdella robusta]ESO04409.1 hypothetical protein HELRODRAFT_154769 [Helobdella robusta]
MDKSDKKHMKKKKEKEKMKALETPEEKRARRLAKKLAKSRKAKEKMGWDEELLGYTNQDNPFGDEHWSDTFVWHKKLENEGKADISLREIEKLQKRKMIENKMELEKVKKRRMERERERQERDNEQVMIQRQKEAEYFRLWERQEDSFHLQQAKLRSKIRIDDGRAKPIDLLAQYISAEDNDLAIEMTEPYNFLNGLTIQDLEDLLVDIKVYVELEQGKNVDYWKDITIVTEEELNKLKKLEYNTADRRSSIHPAVMGDLANVFKGQSLSQLNQLEQQIKDKLKGGEGIDIGYWESLSDLLKAHMAKQRLRERHQEQLRHKLFKLKQEQCIETQPLFPIVRSSHPATISKAPSPTKDEIENKQDKDTEAGKFEENSANVDDENEDDGNEDELLDEEEICLREYSSGRYSPTLIQLDQVPPAIVIVDRSEDLKRLKFARQLVINTGQAQRDEEEELMKQARAGMNEDEVQFSVEVALKPEASVWSDKYRPRKPRFFNRVHTGFEWNKYNQTHYDIDNPPPKIVQGYKFNIFYPDLIDKTKTPQYKVTPTEDKDFAVLRFHASAPYEDIAFKIVNREWEHSYRRGFRCQFQNNIFQLWFHFKRYRYRR